MKKLLFFGLMVVLVSIGSVVNAQETDNDTDSSECSQVYNRFTEAFENNQFSQAMVYWSTCFNSCPKVNINLYINGAKVISNIIKNDANDVRKKELIDTLMLLYDVRITNFGQEGKVLGYKAEDLLYYQPTKLDDVYDMYAKSVTLEGKKSRGGVLSAYFSVATEKYKKHQILKEEAIYVYGNVRQLIDFNLSKDSTDKFYKKAKKEVDDLYVKEYKLDCAGLTSLYGPMYESNSSSVPFLRKLEAVLQARKCGSSDLYKLVEQNLIENDPTSESLEKVAKEYLAQNDLPKAIDTYKKAIAKEPDNDRKAAMYYDLAEATSVNHALSIMFCNNAIQASPTFARPYLLMSKLYAKGSNRCGGSTDAKQRVFMQKSMFWAATDKCETAKSIDPKLANEADKLIAEYELKYPTQEEIDAQQLKVGDSYAINCWLTTVTTVRAKPVKVEESKK
jgi:tetratricopeptide (TPR) repeat protein